MTKIKVRMMEPIVLNSLGMIKCSHFKVDQLYRLTNYYETPIGSELGIKLELKQEKEKK